LNSLKACLSGHHSARKKFDGKMTPTENIEGFHLKVSRTEKELSRTLIENGTCASRADPEKQKFSAISCQTSSAVAASKTRNTRNSFLNQLIKILFRRVPIADNLRLGTKPLLDGMM
jgi:hypothetical protein